MTATAKTILRFFTLLLITSAAMFYLSVASKASAHKIKVQEEELGQSLVSKTSSTDFIFFESVSRFFVSAMFK